MIRPSLLPSNEGDNLLLDMFASNMSAPNMILRTAFIPALFFLFISGCSRRKAPEIPATVITFWHTYNLEETETLNRLLVQFQKTHRDWRIQSTVIPFARAQNEYRRAAQQCRPGAPDLFRAELPWLPEFVDKTLIRAVPAEAPAEALYLTQAALIAHYKGRRWALPASLDCLALLYNRAFLKSPPRTIEQLIEQARRLTRDASGNDPTQPGFDSQKIVRWGFYVRADAYWFLPFLWAEGGDLLDPKSGEVFIDRPAAVDALRLYRDLIHRYQIAPPDPSPANDYEDQLRRFGAGEIAMIVNGPWAMSALLSQPSFREPSRLGVAPFPSGKSSSAAAPLSAHGYVVSACSRQPEASWELARFLSGPSAQAQFARSNSLLPTLRAVYEDPEVGSNPFVREFRRALDRARPRPQHPAIARIFDDFNPAVQAVLSGSADPAEALSAVARAWRRLLVQKPAAP
jgi:arabinogalactan oligomer / maltooligosaccharide transport system substrate-binding protein